MRIDVTNIPDSLGPRGRRVLHEELEKATDQIGLLYRGTVVRKIEETKPFAPEGVSGNLKSGISFVPQEGLKGVVTASPVTMDYAVVQELGRRKGQTGPPPAAILAWVLGKGLATGAAAKRMAFLVGRKLRTKGMPGRFFFRRARQDQPARAKSLQLIGAALRRWKKRIKA